MSEPRQFHDWSWCRELLSQGGDIYHDRMPGGYEVYSARLDAAARERADELKRHCVPREPADRLAGLLAELLEAYAAERFERGARSVTQLEDDATLAIVTYRESGPPCPGCVGTEPASPQSWRCLRHQLLDVLAHAAALEEALQMIVNTHDADTLGGEIARKALKKP